MRALVARLQNVEQRRQELVIQRDELEAGPMMPRLDLAAIERQARRLLANWRDLLGRHTLEARQVLRELLEGPLRFTPIDEEDRRGYRFDGAIQVGALMSGFVDAMRMASPGRIELPA